MPVAAIPAPRGQFKALVGERLQHRSRRCPRCRRACACRLAVFSSSNRISPSCLVLPMANSRPANLWASCSITAMRAPKSIDMRRSSSTSMRMPARLHVGQHADQAAFELLVERQRVMRAQRRAQRVVQAPGDIRLLRRVARSRPAPGLARRSGARGPVPVVSSSVFGGVAEVARCQVGELVIVRAGALEKRNQARVVAGQRRRQASLAQ